MKKEELKYQVELTGSLFFEKETMKFWGDTMSNYGVKTHKDYYELKRKNPVKNGLQTSAYFCKKTFKRIFI